MENTESKEIASVDIEPGFDAWSLGAVSEAVNNQMGENDPIAEVQAPVVEEVKPDTKPEVVQQDDTPTVDDTEFSTAALILKAYADEGLNIDPTEIKPNMSSRELLETLREKIRDEVKPELEQDYSKAGYNEQFKRDIEFLRNGGSLEELQQTFINQSYSQLDIEDDEDTTNREILIKAFYKDKGFSDDKVDKLLDLAKSNGETYEEAVEAQGYFAQKDQVLIESNQLQAKQRQEQQEAEYNKNKQVISDILKNKVLGGIEITDKEAKNIEKAIYDQTEIYEYEDENGRKKQAKMTKYEALLHEYNNNAEWQLTFIKLLLDGFKFDKIASKVVKVRDNQINDVLGAKLTNSANKEKAINKNNNYQPIGTNNDSRMVGEFNI